MILRVNLFMIVAGITVLTAVSHASYLCPDGSYVAQGPCTLCPDGSYVGFGARCQLAPDGRYVPSQGNTSPRLAPDGTYIQGGAGMTLCPDGTYVPGTRCIMMPDGKYVGR